MPAFTATSPGKIILFGEHAVVYGFPAIAVPVTQVNARATVTANIHLHNEGIHIQAPDVSVDANLNDLPANHPLAFVIHEMLAYFGIDRIPACTIRISSTIPIAAGLGSGAAVSVAIIKAFSAFLGHPLPLDKVSEIAFEVEKIHHGTPSGIDNTVVTFAKPVYFERGKPIEILNIKTPFTLVIGDTGIQSPTVNVVSDVRKAWLVEKERYTELFQEISQVVTQARTAIQEGEIEKLGHLMNKNHTYLKELGVSCAELDQLVDVAVQGGALGAKLSGGGRGGNMIALVHEHKADYIANILIEAGATNTIITHVGKFSD